uniref:Uncharacterized protein n=1 Tax=Noctiluca scintillans TaxID=2966 RepID=A0A7S0ZV39_NOCSC|mmetsp:Transcript_19990/g.53427  ORF Transcript_19990/g.53427 Transcript_19990/m.53427 type:complete len:606 (+) Transcript_19990:73-1890(+)
MADADSYEVADSRGLPVAVQDVCTRNLQETSGYQAVTDALFDAAHDGRLDEAVRRVLNSWTEDGIRGEIATLLSDAALDGRLCAAFQVNERGGLNDFCKEMAMMLTKSAHDGTLDATIRHVYAAPSAETFRARVAALLSESVVDGTLVAACNEVFGKSKGDANGDEDASVFSHAARGGDAAATTNHVSADGYPHVLDVAAVLGVSAKDGRLEAAVRNVSDAETSALRRNRMEADLADSDCHGRLATTLAATGSDDSAEVANLLHVSAQNGRLAQTIEDVSGRRVRAELQRHVANNLLAAARGSGLSTAIKIVCGERGLRDQTAAGGGSTTVAHEARDVPTGENDFLDQMASLLSDAAVDGRLCAACSEVRSVRPAGTFSSEFASLLSASQDDELAAAIKRSCGAWDSTVEGRPVQLDASETAFGVRVKDAQPLQYDIACQLVQPLKQQQQQQRDVGGSDLRVRPVSDVLTVPSSNLSADSAARTFLDISCKDQRIGALRALILSMEQRLAKQSGRCLSLEDQLERTQRGLAHLDLDIEWHLRTIHDAETRYEELEKNRERLTEELRIHRRFQLGADLTLLSRPNPTPAWGVGSASPGICDIPAVV